MAKRGAEATTPGWIWHRTTIGESGTSEFSRGDCTRTARDKEFENPLKAINGRGWITGGLEGKQVLCLAGGGGLQAPLYAAAGAVVTVVDISPEMIEQDKRVANERGLKLTALVGSMDDLSMLANASFDLVSQPVSTCYVPNLAKVYDEIARVLRAGGNI